MHYIYIILNLSIILKVTENDFITSYGFLNLKSENNECSQIT